VSVTAAKGFVANGVACGIKESGDLDLALVATADGVAVPAAAVFTQNLVVAAPVTISRAHLASTGGHAAGVVLNSGNANACTGEQGESDAEGMAALAAKSLGCLPQEVLVCSTGLIGPMLPMERIAAAADDLGGGRGSDPVHAIAAAEAIMTTDTCRKEAMARRGAITVGGMAKGAAMLAPNMATMLAVLTTDAAVDSGTLQRVLAAAVDESFNIVTVDGCTSTNDTVMLLASGQAGDAGSPAGSDGSNDESALADAVSEVCLDLAMQMVGDAEGHTKVVRVSVSGAATPAEARQAARKVAESQLVKCSWYGADPYWGRITSDLGTAGVQLDLARLSIAYGGVVVSLGCVGVDHDAAALAAHMAGEHLDVHCDLGVGRESAHVLTNDLSHAYIDENMRTS